MPDFQRARNREQKEERIREIKAAADSLFQTVPYHQITLSAIAENLKWSRANLYKYVSTKEEIYLELAGDKRDAYFTAFKSAFPPGSCYSPSVFSEVWAEILNAHRDYLHYSSILLTIIETNVSVERLANFKQNYYHKEVEILCLLEKNLKISGEMARTLFYDVYYHAVGLIGSCLHNPLIREALKLIPMEVTEPDFRRDMRRFISMCLEHCGISDSG